MNIGKPPRSGPKSFSRWVPLLGGFTVLTTLRQILYKSTVLQQYTLSPYNP